MSDEVYATILAALSRYAEELAEEARALQAGFFSGAGTATDARLQEIGLEDERIEAAEWFVRAQRPDLNRSPADHCFREESASDLCDLCGHAAGEHTGCDCEG